jgi:hypothetical protein
VDALEDRVIRVNVLADGIGGSIGNVGKNVATGGMGKGIVVKLTEGGQGEPELEP